MENLNTLTIKKSLDPSKKMPPGLLQKFPLAPVISELQSHNDLLNPLSFSKKFHSYFAELKAQYGISGVAAYQKLILVNLIDDLWGKLNEKSLPPRIVSLYLSWFERVHEDFSSQPDFYYDIENEFWPISHDLAICSGRTIPVGGAWFIERRLLPRKIMTFMTQEWHQNMKRMKKPNDNSLHKSLSRVLKNFGLYEAINRMFAASPKLFGCSWCYIIHTAGRNIKDFNATNMNIAYENIVELLQTDQSVWGVFRESWFLDPDLKRISPDLQFLWETPLQKGAKLYYGGPCNAYDLKRALLFSPIRSKMYQEGKYTPRTYFYFWPRKRMIDECYEM